MNFLSSKKITTLFSKGALSLLSTTFVSSFVLLSFLPQHFSFVVSQKSYFQSSLVFPQLTSGIFDTLVSSVKSVAKNVLQTAQKVIQNVTSIPDSIKKATTTTATTSQKVIAIGSVGGGMALIALLFFFIL